MNATIVNQQAPARLSLQELRRRWQQMLHDPVLADVPGKIELTEKGTIELSPPNTRHSIGDLSALPRAPELCVEVLSPSNTEPEMQQKTAAYLAAGALEVWLVKEDGTVEILNERGRVAASSLGIAIGPLPR